MRPPRRDFLPFSLPSIGDEEIAEVVAALKSGWITTGPRVKRFEDAIAGYVGSQHAVAVASATAGLHIALRALDVGPGDEVIVPTMTFCSMANVVLHLGARLVLVDVGPDFNVTADAIEAALSPATRAIAPVHFAGQPCDMEAITAVARRHQVPVVDDAAHAIGAELGGRKIGTLGAMTVFSFYATKNLTTGEGGMVTTDDPALADRVRRLSLHGMSRDAWKRYTNAGSWFYEVVEPGYKSNMSDVQAALGIHQLAKLDGFIARRAQIAGRYTAAFASLPQVAAPRVLPGRRHAWHLYVISLALDRLDTDRGGLIEDLRARNIGCSVHFIPVHRHPFYRELGYKPAMFPRAEALYAGCISLPLYPGMSDDDVDDVIAAVTAAIERR
ncbi:MAG TPA: DegT/DnrJ/EryC1/StrS aminotransferase family protein, partial [Methylomirabilota bacterium]